MQFPRIFITSHVYHCPGMDSRSVLHYLSRIHNPPCMHACIIKGGIIPPCMHGWVFMKKCKPTDENPDDVVGGSTPAHFMTNVSPLVLVVLQV